MNSTFHAILALCVASLSLPALAAENGTVQGRVPLPKKLAAPISVEKYAGSISGKVEAAPVAVAGVWLEPANGAPAAAPKPAALSQKGYQFRSSLLVVQTGTTVVFPNEDDDYHNVFSLSKTKRFDLGRYKKNEAPPPSVTFDKPGFIRLLCEIHEHMRGTILVVDSPYFATTDAGGNFSLAGIPPGSYTVRAQLDEKHKWSAKVTVSTAKAVEVTLQAE